MKLSGDAYSKRLESFSDFTLVLISGINGMDKDMIRKSNDITTDSKLTEEQVIEGLLKIIRSSSESLASLSYEDALEIVCDAFEQGCFYSLYEILDDNATLIFADDDMRVSGSRGIIELLVKERCDHLYCSDEKTITCDIFKIAEGERYGIGEKCVLLTYHLENGKQQHHIIKVHFANGVINKFEVFHPLGPLRLVAVE